MYAFISLFAMKSLLKWLCFCFCMVSGQFLTFKLAFSLNWFWHNPASCSTIIIYSCYQLKQRLNGFFPDLALHFKKCSVPLAKQGFEVVSQSFSSHFSILWSYFITLLFVQYVISHYLYFFSYFTGCHNLNWSNFQNTECCLLYLSYCFKSPNEWQWTLTFQRCSFNWLFNEISLK